MWQRPMLNDDGSETESCQSGTRANIFTDVANAGQQNPTITIVVN